MKKISTVFTALLFSLISFAQKDIEIKLLSPANNSVQYENESFDLTHSYKNVGSDTIYPSDSFFVSLKIDGQYILGDYNKHLQAHGTILPGDSVFFTRQFTFTYSHPTALAFCFELTTSNNGIVVDNNLTNNETCANITIVQRGSTGINTVTTPPALILYPNPAAENLFIKTTHPQAQQAVITEITGRQITTLNLQKGETTLCVAHLPSGVYFCRLISAQGSISMERFVVSH